MKKSWFKDKGSIFDIETFLADIMSATAQQKRDADPMVGQFGSNGRPILARRLWRWLSHKL